MHFRTLRYKARHILWLTSFLSYFGEDDIEFACSEEVSAARKRFLAGGGRIDKASLPKKTRVLVMDYV